MKLTNFGAVINDVDGGWVRVTSTIRTSYKEGGAFFEQPKSWDISSKAATKLCRWNVWFTLEPEKWKTDSNFDSAWLEYRLVITGGNICL